MTRKKTHRYALHVSVGPPGACPDCGRPTPFCKASLLGECSKEPWVVDAELLQGFASTLAKFDKPICRSCKSRTVRLFWIEVADGAVVGPFCSTCLRSKAHDAPVYVAPASKQTILAAKVAARFAPKPPPVSAPDTQLI